MSFQLVGSTWFLSFGDDPGVFLTLFFKWVLLFHLLSPVPGMLKPSEPQWTVTEIHFPSHHPLFFLQQNLEWNASSCWWSLKLLSISHRGKYIYISIFLALLSSFQFLVSSGILQSGVLAAAKGEQILCYWNVFTDLLFCILCFGIQLICDVVKSSSSQMPMIAS